MEGARPAGRQDAEACAALCRMAMEELQSQRGGSLFARRESGLVAKALLRPGGLDGLLASSRCRVLVGTIDGAVVGLAVAHLDDVGEASLGVVDGCYVEPAGRGVGVGRALIEALLGWFSSASCRGVDMATLPGDRRTKNFLEAAGFKGRLITMHKPLP